MKNYPRLRSLQAFVRDLHKSENEKALEEVPGPFSKMPKIKRDLLANDLMAIELH